MCKIVINNCINILKNDFFLYSIFLRLGTFQSFGFHFRLNYLMFPEHSLHLYIKRRKMYKANGKYICKVTGMIIALMRNDRLDKKSPKTETPVPPIRLLKMPFILFCSNFRVETKLFLTGLNVENAL